MSQIPNSPDTVELERKFLRACLSFEATDVSFETASKIHDCLETLEEALREGLDASKPFTLEAVSADTPVGFAVSVFSDMAFKMHEIAGEEEHRFVPSLPQSQCQMAAALAMKRVVNAALETTGQIVTGADPDDERRSLHQLCAPDDHEMIDRCVQAGVPLGTDYVARMRLDSFNRMLNLDGAAVRAVSEALQDPATAADMAAAINRPTALLRFDAADFEKLNPVLRQALRPDTIDAALLECVRGEPRAETAAGLLALGANALGERAHNPQEPSALWHALKDSYGVDTAMLLAPRTPDLNETHDNQSLLARACERRNDELVKLMVDAGARFASVEEARVRLVEAAELGLMHSMRAALDQGVGVNDIDASASRPRTALICAGLFDRREAVEMLLERGADPHLQVQKWKMLPGGPSVIKTDFVEEVVRIEAFEALDGALESRGVEGLQPLPDLNPRDGKPSSLLMRACDAAFTQQQRYASPEFLIEMAQKQEKGEPLPKTIDALPARLAQAGAKFRNDDEPQIVLVKASVQNMSGLVDFALDQGADINRPAQALNSMPALMLAAGYDNEQIVAKLLQRGADPLLQVTVTIPTPEGPADKQVNFYDIVLQQDAAKSLQAAGQQLGAAAIMDLAADAEASPWCEALLKVVRKTGAIPDKLPKPVAPGEWVPVSDEEIESFRAAIRDGRPLPDIDELVGERSVMARLCKQVIALQSMGEELDGLDTLLPDMAKAGAGFVSEDEAHDMLLYASMEGVPAMIDFMLDRGVDVNRIMGPETDSPVTALILAGVHNRPESVKKLLERGADPDVKVELPLSEDATEPFGFFDAVVAEDAVNALHAAAEKLGPDALKGIKADEDSPDCRDLLAAMRARGSVPPLTPEMIAKAQERRSQSDGGAPADIQSLQSLIDLAQKQGTKIIGVGPGGMTIGI